MWGLIKRTIVGRAPQQGLSTHQRLAADIERGIADARARRLARPARSERERFARAQPKLAQLKRAIAMQHVEF